MPRRTRPVALTSALASVLAMASCASSDAATATTAPAPAAAGETHAEVAWDAWERDTFARARDDNRIILINVVATWCHWCHVMEEETYANPEVAALLAEDFVTIRIDSDARPDVAERYRAWGWPATAVLSPRAEPILELRGFQSPEEFAGLLRSLVADRDAGTLARRDPPRTPTKPTNASLEARRAFAVRRLDHFYSPKGGGGWGRTQKYPLPAPLEHALWRLPLHGEDWTARAEQTLRSQINIIDPVWGGIYQYSVRGDWEHPHYEKITAIEAGAIVDYAMAARAFSDEQWLGPAQDVARYMTQMMRDERGGFYTSQDADLRREGAQTVVGADYYAMNDAGRRALGMPRIDTNVYADLNGLMIHALTELYRATADEADLQHARDAAAQLMETHRTAQGAFLHGEDDDPEGLLYLRDQVTVARGLLSLYRVTGERSYRDEARRVADFVLANLQDDAGGFFAHTEDPAAVGVFAQRRKPLEENGLAARFLAELHRVSDGDGTEPTPYLRAAERALESIGDEETVREEYRLIGEYLLGLEAIMMPTVDVTVVGAMDEARTKALHAAALAHFDPRAVIEVSAPGERYPDIGKPAVYLCTDTACSTPIDDPQAYSAEAAAFIERVLPTP